MEEHQIVQQMFDDLFDTVTGPGFYTVEDGQKKKLKLKKANTSVDNETQNKKESTEPGSPSSSSSVSQPESPAKDGKSFLCKQAQKKIFLGRSDFRTNENEELESLNQRKRKLGDESCERHFEPQKKRSNLDGSAHEESLTADFESSENDSNPLTIDNVSPDIRNRFEESDSAKAERSLQGCQGSSGLVSSNESDANLLTVAQCENDGHKKTILNANSSKKDERPLQVCPDNPDLVVSSRRQKKKSDLSIKPSEKKIQPEVIISDKRLPSPLDLPSQVTVCVSSKKDESSVQVCPDNPDLVVSSRRQKKQSDLSIRSFEKKIQPDVIISDERLPSLLDLPSQVTDEKDVDRESIVSTDSRMSGYIRTKGSRQSPRKKGVSKDSHEIPTDEKLSTTGSGRPKSKLSLKRKLDVEGDKASITKRQKVDSKMKNISNKSSKARIENTGKRNVANSEMKHSKENTQRGKLNSSSRTKLKHSKGKFSRVTKKQKNAKLNQNNREMTITRSSLRKGNRKSTNYYLEMSPIAATRTKLAKVKVTSKCKSPRSKVSSNDSQRSKSNYASSRDKSEEGSSTPRSKLTSAHSGGKSRARTSKQKTSNSKTSRSKTRSAYSRAKSPYKSDKEPSNVKGQRTKSKLRQVKNMDSSMLYKQEKILVEHSRLASGEETNIMSALCKLEDKSKSLQSQDLEDLMPMRDDVTTKTSIFVERGVFKDSHPGGVWKKLVLEN